MKKFVVLFMALAILLATLTPVMAGGPGWNPRRPYCDGYGRCGNSYNDWWWKAPLIAEGIFVFGKVLETAVQQPYYPPPPPPPVIINNVIGQPQEGIRVICCTGGVPNCPPCGQ